MESIKQTKFVTFLVCLTESWNIEGKEKENDVIEIILYVHTYIHYNRFSRLTEMQLKVLTGDEIVCLRL